MEAEICQQNQLCGSLPCSASLKGGILLDQYLDQSSGMHTRCHSNFIVSNQDRKVICASERVQASLEMLQQGRHWRKQSIYRKAFGISTATRLK